MRTKVNKFSHTWISAWSNTIDRYFVTTIKLESREKSRHNEKKKAQFNIHSMCNTIHSHCVHDIKKIPAVVHFSLKVIWAKCSFCEEKYNYLLLLFATIIFALVVGALIGLGNSCLPNPSGYHMLVQQSQYRFLLLQNTHTHVHKRRIRKDTALSKLNICVWLILREVQTKLFTVSAWWKKKLILILK